MKPPSMGKDNEMWSLKAEQVLRKLIAELPPEHLDPTHTHAARLGALPIGGSMWTDYYLRPNGDVVIVGEELDRPDVDSVYRDRVVSYSCWSGVQNATRNSQS